MSEPLGKFARPVNFATFQAGWFACVWGAGQGWVWLGPLFVAMATLFQSRFVAGMSRREWLFLCIGSLVGLLLDTGMIAAGVYDPVRTLLPWPLAPVWIVALWVLFTGSFGLSLQWLRGRTVFACLLGALAAPLSYSAGARLGACTLHPGFFRSYLVLGIVWGIAVPALFRLYGVLLPCGNGASPGSDTPGSKMQKDGSGP